MAEIRLSTKLCGSDWYDKLRALHFARLTFIRTSPISSLPGCEGCSLEIVVAAELFSGIVVAVEFQGGARQVCLDDQTR
jgi:hypothetical protein